VFLGMICLLPLAFAGGFTPTIGKLFADLQGAEPKIPRFARRFPAYEKGFSGAGARIP
jgi:hypothetical protein